MRRIRWKPVYQRVDQGYHGALADLVNRLNAFAAEADQVAHCGDLNELFEGLRDRVRDRVERHEGGDLVKAVRTELDTGLPLAARGGPACTECGMCDALDERLRKWAEETEKKADWRRTA